LGKKTGLLSLSLPLTLWGKDILDTLELGLSCLKWIKCTNLP
jgi:hypothetical protein